MLVLEFTGAGSLALYWLHSVGGSSRTILEATDRYAAGSLQDLLGYAPEKAVSEETASRMAAEAYRRARRLAPDATPCLGVGLTASIATDRPKKGPHHVWIGVRASRQVVTTGLVFEKGARTRSGEERVIAQLLVRVVAAACGVEAPDPDLLPGEVVKTRVEPAPDAIQQLLDGEIRSVTVHPDGHIGVEEPVVGGLLSGSFNPLHTGHERLAQAASLVLGAPVWFELPVLNADKPPLAYGEIERRLAQFRWRYPVLLSRAPLFLQKAEIFPGVTFVVGYDTAVRLVDPRYYGGEAGRDEALRTLQARGCRFLVAGRVQQDRFLTLLDLTVPEAFQPLFLPLPEEAFRVDLSSTAIREAGSRMRDER